MGLIIAAMSASLDARATQSQGQGTGSSRVPSENEAESYFPKDFSEDMTVFLHYYGEPSLMATAKDSSVVAYRFESIAGQSGRSVAVRLVVNEDGTGKIFVADWFIVRDSSGDGARVLRKSEMNVAAADVGRFLHAIDRANFWKMPVTEPPDPKRYTTDADTYVFEGVRAGEYHVAMRRGPEGGTFEEMIALLVRDLAGLKGTAIPPPKVAQLR